MSEHFTRNRQDERNGLKKGEDYFEDSSSNKQKLTVEEHFPQMVNVYFIFL